MATNVSNRCVDNCWHMQCCSDLGNETLRKTEFFIALLNFISVRLPLVGQSKNHWRSSQ